MALAHRLVAAVTGVVALAMTTPPAHAGPGTPGVVTGQVLTVAGIGEEGYSGDGHPGRDARLGASLSVAAGPDGSVYIADMMNGRLRRVAPDGVIDTVPGTRALRSPKNDSPEIAGWIHSPSNSPYASAVAEDGTVHLAAKLDIRRIDPDGKITVVGGNGKSVDGHADGRPATAASIYEPQDIAVGPDGAVFVADRNNSRIRRIDVGGTITTVAGGGTLDRAAAEGKAATSARIGQPKRVAVDASGTVYFSSGGDRAVHRVGSDGVLTRVTELPGEDTRIGGIALDRDGVLHVTDAGRGVVFRVGAGGTATQVGPQFADGAQDLAIGVNGDFYVAGRARVVRLVRAGGDRPAVKVEPARSRWAGDQPGTVHTVAAGGPRDQAPATRPLPERTPGASGIAVGPDGAVYVAEPNRSRVRRIDRDGRVHEFAGTGRGGVHGDGGPAGQAELRNPQAVAADAAGNVYIADTAKGQIRRVDPGGVISTFATIAEPLGVGVGPAGTVFVTAGEVVHRFDAQGNAVVVAGGGKLWADRADDAPAGQAQLWKPESLAVGPDSTVYFVEQSTPAVRAIRPDGILVTVAGSSYRRDDEGGFAGDGGPAPLAELNTPSGLAVGPDGSRYVADTFNNRIRRVAPDGTISTVAGTGERADNGDGGPATKAAVKEPTGVAVGADNTLYVAGSSTSPVRRITPDGTISTLADLTSADEREQPAAALGAVDSFAVGPDGAVHLSDTNGAVHRIAPDGALAPVDMNPLGESVRLGVLATGPDGSLYLAAHEVVRVTPDGAEVVVAGSLSAQQPPSPDQPATNAALRVEDLAVGPTGELHLTSRGSVYALRDDRLVEVLGAGGEGERRGRITVGPDGVLYVVAGHRVLAVRDGRAEPVAGNGQSTSPSSEEEDEDGGPALEASLSHPTDVAVTADGTLFVSTSDGIRRVTTDGDIDTVLPPRSDGRPPASTLAVGPGEDLYFLDRNRNELGVLVRPAELDIPFRFPWVVLWIAVAAVVLAAAAVLVIRRRSRKQPEEQAEGQAQSGQRSEEQPQDHGEAPASQA